jgi:hypothetical protein
MTNQIFFNEELIVSNMLEIQSLIRILTRKGITDEDEILGAIKKLKREMTEKIRRMSKEVNLCGHLSGR